MEYSSTALCSRTMEPILIPRICSSPIIFQDIQTPNRFPEEVLSGNKRNKTLTVSAINRRPSIRCNKINMRVPSK